MNFGIALEDSSNAGFVNKDILFIKCNSKNNKVFHRLEVMHDL